MIRVEILSYISLILIKINIIITKKDLYVFSSILENVNLDLLLLVRSVFFSCLGGSDGVVVGVNCDVRVLLFCCCW